MQGPWWVIDAMNVIGSRPDGWWRDREAAKRRLIDRLSLAAEDGPAPITVVLDGRPLDGLPEGVHGGVQILYAPRPGPNAADDRIVEVAEELNGDLVVITSDRALRDRILDLGGQVRPASYLLSCLDDGTPLPYLD